MPDIFDHNVSNLGSPCTGAADVVPSDAGELAQFSRALYVAGAGNLSVVMKDGQQLTFQNIGAGTLLPVRVRRVRATGTTATGIIALW